MSFSGALHSPNIYSQDDLPKTLARTLHQGSNVMSLDFHPVQQTILLGCYSNHGSTVQLLILIVVVFLIQITFVCLIVGTNVGDIGIWEVGSRERIAHKTFKVWNIGSCTLPLQVTCRKLNASLLLIRLQIT